eukprot:TRINITY_DN3019_c0_g2_i1.p1 TRINITY_DN3019_c0_g2~~TRINITY_DN3019_c0_g2_i1.p1  ORF type:complete len:96 (-),score=5.37 TRINITY_DN3019_c0_g2_i1:209-496(-)
MMDSGNGIVLDDVHTRLIDELSEICEDSPLKEYTSKTIQENLNVHSSYPSTVRYFNQTEKPGISRTITNSFIAPRLDCFDGDSENSSVVYEQNIS